MKLLIRINAFSKKKKKPGGIKSFSKKYSDMLNMKALVGIRIILMGKEYE